MIGSILCVVYAQNWQGSFSRGFYRLFISDFADAIVVGLLAGLVAPCCCHGSAKLSKYFTYVWIDRGNALLRVPSLLPFVLVQLMLWLNDGTNDVIFLWSRVASVAYPKLEQPEAEVCGSNTGRPRIRI